MCKNVRWQVRWALRKVRLSQDISCLNSSLNDKCCPKKVLMNPWLSTLSQNLIASSDNINHYAGLSSVAWVNVWKQARILLKQGLVGLSISKYVRRQVRWALRKVRLSQDICGFNSLLNNKCCLKEVQMNPWLGTLSQNLIARSSENINLYPGLPGVAWVNVWKEARVLLKQGLVVCRCAKM